MTHGDTETGIVSESSLCGRPHRPDDSGVKKIKMQARTPTSALRTTSFLSRSRGGHMDSSSRRLAWNSSKFLDR